MSAYSDWHCGAISDDEYRLAYAFDQGEDHGEQPHEDELGDYTDMIPNQFDNMTGTMNL